MFDNLKWYSHNARLFKTFNQRPVIKILKINNKFSHPFTVLSYTSACEYPGLSYSGTVNNVPLSGEAFSSGPYRQLLEVPPPPPGVNFVFIIRSSFESLIQKDEAGKSNVSRITLYSSFKNFKLRSKKRLHSLKVIVFSSSGQSTSYVVDTTDSPLLLPLELQLLLAWNFSSVGRVGYLSKEVLHGWRVSTGPHCRTHKSAIPTYTYGGSFYVSGKLPTYPYPPPPLNQH